MNIQPVSSSSLTTVAASGPRAASGSGAAAPPGVDASTEVKAASTAGTNTAVAATNASAEAQKTPTNSEALEKAVDDVKQAIAPTAQDLLFSIDKGTGKTVVKVVDAATKKVIKQIPSEEILAIAKSLDNFDKLRGLLVKQKV